MSRPISIKTQGSQAVSSHLLAHQPNRRQSVRAVDANALKKNSVNAALALQRTEAAMVDRLAPRLDVDEAALDTSVATSLVEQLERDFELDFRAPVNFSTSHRRELEERWRNAPSDGIFKSGRHLSQNGRRTGPLKRRRTSQPASLRRKTEQFVMLDERTQHASCLLKALEDEFAAGLASEQGWSARRTALDMHLRSMGVTRVLTRNEEAHLFAIFNRVNEYDLSRTEKPTAEALQAASEAHGVSTAILSTYVSQSQRARSLLLRFNMRLVLATAKRFLAQSRLNGVPFEDLLPEGHQGLMAAMLKFEPERGFKFSSYSVWHIRQRVQRCIQKESRVVYVPAHVQENLPRVLNATAKLQEMRGEGAVVTDQDIADVLGMRASKVKTIRQSMQPMVFLDDLLYAGSGAKGEQSEASYMEIISDDSAEVAQEDEQQDKAIQECLNAVLQTLHPRERNILRLRYGLNTERRKVSRLEIADAYGLSHERIRQIEDEAVRKLMVPWRRQVLEEHSAGAL